MPELPDVDVYVEALARRTDGAILESVRLASPFVLRTAVPPLPETFGHTVRSVRRLGKRIVVGLEGDLFLVVHLMIAGRFRWKPKGAGIPGRIGLAAFDFSTGTLLFTEASPKKRASLHVVVGEAAVQAFHAGGIELLDRRTKQAQFDEVLRKERHTLKRTLTDPHLVSGVGNAYSDEILHRAQLSPVRMSDSLDATESQRLFATAKEVLVEWRDRLRKEAGDGFPENVTAFRPEMAVHGKYGKPCPVCGTPVQRIRYADNETNYCPTCQTGGKLLADRSLSRLLKGDWPKSIEELEARKRES
jgi:formamidopyrimidine-DNA glycosylase